ncbi:MAG: GspH/FimT family pseudopilin [Gammaproteobacteria bacterium]|nr:GspH/FimT family pseudopilin [Gammaproteobacteria bacterium]
MKKHTGFTLVELMIALIIVSILLAVGMPSLKGFLQSNQLIAATNELLSAIHIARSEAIKLNTSVTICESTNGTSCTDPGTDNWEDGWIVFVDSDGNLAGTGVACAAVGTDCLLRSHSAFTDNQLTMAGVNAGGVDISSITFDSRGMPRSAAGASLMGTFSICSLDSSGSTIGSRAVIVNISGRVRVSDNAAVISCP